MTGSDLLSALTPVIEALEALGVLHYIGGSLASSAHGVPRASIDADVIADLKPEHASPLVSRLQAAYYLDEGRAPSPTLSCQTCPGTGASTSWSMRRSA